MGLHPAKGGGQQDPFATAVEGVTEVATDPAARHDQFLLDPGHRVHEGGVGHLDEAERHCEPQQRAVDPRVTGEADERSAQGVLGTSDTGRDLVGSGDRGVVPEHPAGIAEAGRHSGQRRGVHVARVFLPAVEARRLTGDQQVADDQVSGGGECVVEQTASVDVIG